MHQTFKFKSVSLTLCAWALAVGLVSCSGGNEAVQTPCEGVVCGSGRCEVSDGRAVCACEPGHHAEGLTCVRDDAPPLDPCAPNPCVQPGRGQCTNLEGKPVCACEPGKEEDGSGQCIPTDACAPNPCTAPHKTDCSVVEGQAVCACVSGHVPEGEACVPSGPDGHGDTPAESSPVIIDAPPTGGSFERADDVDLFSFQAQAGHIYAFTCNPGGGAVDCQVSLSDAAGQVLAVDNSGGTGFIVYEYTTAGTYYFRVSSGQVGTYTYQLEDLGLDDHGDTRDTATASTPGASATPARLEVPGDVDFLKFGVGAGLNYSFTCTSTAFACAVELQDAAGGVLASGTASADAVTLQYAASGEATLYVRIAAESASAMGAYSWRMQAASVDDHGDTAATATALVPSTSSLTGQLETPGDQDWFSFSGVLNTSYEFTCTSTAVDCNVVLYDAAGKVIQSDTSTQPNAKVLHLARAPGTFFLKVSGGTAAFGSYTYRLRDLGVDDHGDTPSEATPVTPSSSSIGATLHATTDVDVFSFEAPAGHIYELACNTSAFDCDLVLMNALGTVVAEDTTSTTYARVRVELNTPGTYYFRIQPGDSKVGAYTYRLQDLGVDDHGDTLATATPITPGASWVPAQFEVPKDEDWFTFTAPASHIYDIGCSTSSIDCDVYVLDAAGTVVASDTSSSSRLRRKFAAGGTYYIRLVANGGWNVSYTRYSYLLNDLGLDDHGDTLATATPITPSASWVPAQFEVPRDEDWFSFTALAGHIYDIGCSTSSIDCDVYVLDAAGTVVASDTSSSSRLRRKLTTGGMYYIRFVANTGWNISYTRYSYLLNDLGVDDHADTFVGATVLTLGTATPGNIEYSGDVDFFQVNLAASTSYTVTTTGISPTLTVYAPDKTTVISTGSSPRAFTSNAAGGVHYVRVSGSTTGAYTVKLQ